MGSRRPSGDADSEDSTWGHEDVPYIDVDLSSCGSEGSEDVLHDWPVADYLNEGGPTGRSSRDYCSRTVDPNISLLLENSDRNASLYSHPPSLPGMGMDTFDLLNVTQNSQQSPSHLFLTSSTVTGADSTSTVVPSSSSPMEILRSSDVLEQSLVPDYSLAGICHCFIVFVFVFCSYFCFSR